MAQLPTRRILAIRHGESEWNVLRALHPSEKERYHPRMCTIDCGVTELGQQQAQQAGVELSRMVPKVDVVLVSPLRRALQTASSVLESFSVQPPVEVCRDAAEVMLDPCDIGSPPSKLSEEFPSFDFSNLDEFWWHGTNSPEQTLELMTQRQGLESEDTAQIRMEALKVHLRERPEDIIVLVCHSETIWWLTSQIKEGERHGVWSKNGEIVDITDFLLERDAGLVPIEAQGRLVMQTDVGTLA